MSIRDWLRGECNYVKLAAIVIVAAAILRFALTAISHPAGDSCWHLSVVRFIAQTGKIPFSEPFGQGREYFWAPPLFHLVAALVYKAFSLLSIPAAEFGVKLVSPLFGSLTLPFVFLIGRKLHGPKIGFLALLFVAFLPIHINSSVVSFVDAFTAFMVAVSVYFLVSRRIFLSALFIGLGIASKQTVLFMVPVFFIAVFFLYRQRLKSFFAKSAISAAIMAAVGVPWLVRNYVLFKNPFWPFLYKILGGTVMPSAAESGFSVFYLFSLSPLKQFYLELFGAPLGKLDTASFIHLPFIHVFLAVWLAVTIIFFIPAVIGLVVSVKKKSYLILGWILAFLVVVAIFVMNIGSASARYFVPAVPALGIVWALGLDQLLSKFGHVRLPLLKVSAVFMIVIFGCIIAFSVVESAKTVVAARAWNAFAPDFSWIRENTPKDVLFGYRGQCLSYNIDRLSNFNLSQDDYVWVNQDFRLEPVSILDQATLQAVQRGFTPVYNNTKTGTIIYKRNS